MKRSGSWGRHERLGLSVSSGPKAEGFQGFVMLSTFYRPHLSTFETFERLANFSIIEP
jgi:hypothetical protein